MVILCESEKVSRLEEQNITDIIGQHLGEKGVILCLKTPRGELVLHTRLRYGTISYETNDVVHRTKEWEATGYLTRDLHAKWQSIADAELKIYQSAKGVHTVVHPGGQTVKHLMKQASDFISTFFPSSDNKDGLDLD